MRPDHTSAPISVDSAAVVARDLLSTDFGLDLSLFEPLPPSETIIEARNVREFRWRLRQALPRGAVALASVRPAGADLVESKLQLELPPAVMRRIEQEKQLLGAVGGIALGVCILVAFGFAMRERYFVFPAARTFFLNSVAVATVLLASQNYRSDLVEKG